MTSIGSGKICMSSPPVELTLEFEPKSRFEIIDVTSHIRANLGDKYYQYDKALYCSMHTTAGFLEQSLCARLQHSPNNVDPFFKAFQKLFPAGAAYQHDQLQLREELSDAQRQREPKNADSHLIFISAGLKNCVRYSNQPDIPVYLIELDGVNGAERRHRQTSVLAYNHEEVVLRETMQVPVSRHPVDSVNLRDEKLGFFAELNEKLRDLGITKGRVEIALNPAERNAGVTVNEYETLLMRYDLAEVLRNPLKFFAMQGKHMLLDPRAIPSKTINYAKYDLVHFFNEIMDAFGVSESVVEKILSKFIAVPAARFLHMKRDLSLLVTDRGHGGFGQIVHGTYQSPILVQWGTARGQTRKLDVVITRFD